MEACGRWKRLIMVNSMQANEAPQERMSAAWRLHKRGYEPRRGSVMVKTIDATTTDRLRRSPLYLDLSPSCARKRACMELTTICRFQRLLNPSFLLFQCSRSITSLLCFCAHCFSTAIITHSYFGYIQSSPRTREFGGCL